MPFHPSEEYLLFWLQAVIGNKWSAISLRLAGRTESAVKNRYYSALRRVQRASKSSQDDAVVMLTAYTLALGPPEGVEAPDDIYLPIPDPDHPGRYKKIIGVSKTDIQDKISTSSTRNEGKDSEKAKIDGDLSIKRDDGVTSRDLSPSNVQRAGTPTEAMKSEKASPEYSKEEGEKSTQGDVGSQGYQSAGNVASEEWQSLSQNLRIDAKNSELGSESSNNVSSNLQSATQPNSSPTMETTDDASDEEDYSDIPPSGIYTLPLKPTKWIDPREGLRAYASTLYNNSYKPMTVQEMYNLQYEEPLVRYIQKYNIGVQRTKKRGLRGVDLLVFKLRTGGIKALAKPLTEDEMVAQDTPSKSRSMYGGEGDFEQSEGKQSLERRTRNLRRTGRRASSSVRYYVDYEMDNAGMYPWEGGGDEYYDDDQLSDDSQKSKPRKRGAGRKRIMARAGRDALGDMQSTDSLSALESIASGLYQHPIDAALSSIVPNLQHANYLQQKMAHPLVSNFGMNLSALQPQQGVKGLGATIPPLGDFSKMSPQVTSSFSSGLSQNVQSQLNAPYAQTLDVGEGQRGSVSSPSLLKMGGLDAKYRTNVMPSISETMRFPTGKSL